MKAMGSKKGFDPIPPDQHSWTLASGQPPLLRMWGHMCAHTIRKGHRKPYAVDAHGKPITLEDIARDLKMDPALCRRTWRDGMRIGLWRKGTNAKDKRYLYLNGQVIPVVLSEEEQRIENEDDNTEKDCTILFAPYISKQIKQLPKERREMLMSRFRLIFSLKKEIHANLQAATRLIFDQKENNIFSEFGIKKIREERKNGKSTDEPQDRAARVLTVLPSVERIVQSFEERTVQSRADFVQSQKSETVQSFPPLVSSEVKRVSLGEDSSRQVGSVCTARTEEALTYLPPLSPRLDPRRDLAFTELVAVIEQVAVPEIGETPTEAQYREIFSHLNGASSEHYRQKLEAKKALGKLNSVMILKHLADDCAKSKDKWKPPTKPVQKSFVSDVAEGLARRLKTGTL